MLHGVGDTGINNSAEIYFIGFFMVPYAADLSRSLPNVRFVCPTGAYGSVFSYVAPMINLTARQGAKVHAWVVISVFSECSLIFHHGTGTETTNVQEWKRAATL